MSIDVPVPPRRHVGIDVPLPSRCCPWCGHALDGDASNWMHATVEGPNGTPWHGGCLHDYDWDRYHDGLRQRLTDAAAARADRSGLSRRIPS